MDYKFENLANKIFIKVAPVLPQIVYEGMAPAFSEQVRNIALGRRIEKFARKMIQNPSFYLDRVIKNRNVMEIQKGSYKYDYFNVCYLNNMVNLILYSLYKGCIPIIKINEDEAECNKWEWYFKQPLEVLLNTKDISKDYDVKYCQIQDSPFKCTYAEGYYPYSKNFEIWKFLYEKFVVFNQETEDYIKKEKQQLLKGKTLGVLLRGTDFTSLCPSGHPVQPDVKKVLMQIEKWKTEKEYRYIYVATEEKRLFDHVKKCFGEDNVLSNSRTYYDEQYYNSKHEYIGEVHFERDNDNFLKGLEYLSSITILSSCDGLVSGNCGGSMYALLRSTDYKDICVFNEGYY